MITRKEISDLLILECEICKHLATKIPKSKLNYRPGKKMRSALELMRYLSFFGAEAVRIFVLDAFKTNQWDEYTKAEQKSQSLKPAQFGRAMDAQIREIRKLMAKIPEGDLARKKVSHPMGGTIPLGKALLELSGRFMCGYRMQLFLYAKANNSKLGTSNCWFGKDPKKS